MAVDPAKLKASMEATKPALDAKSGEDSRDIEELTALRTSREKAEIDGIKQQNANVRANRRLRTRYADKVYCYLVCYSCFVGVLLILHGWKICGFSLPENVLSFLVGSTAAAAIGLVYSVSNGLFSQLSK